MHGIDVETAGTNGGGALDPSEGRLRLVQISDGEETDIYDAFRQDKDVIRRAIESREELVAHNATFERKWLNAALALDRPDLHDTMIMSQVYYTGTRAALGKNFSHSIKSAVKRELKQELSKDEQTSDWAAMALTREQLEYAAEDARILPKLADTLMRKIDRAGLRDVYELERRVSRAVEAMQSRGVAVHCEKLEEITAEATEKGAPQGRAHGNPFGAATGRFSSSSPDLQNIPKRGDRGARARSVFWSGADDRVLVKADYVSIELWVAAVLWDDPHMQHALQQGLDMHVATAASLFNVKPGQTSPLNVRRIGGVAMAGKPALASVPVTQEPYRNRDCEDSRAHTFCHAKYTHVSQTLWRGLSRGTSLRSKIRGRITSAFTA